MIIGWRPRLALPAIVALLLLFASLLLLLESRDVLTSPDALIPDAFHWDHHNTQSDDEPHDGNTDVVSDQPHNASHPIDELIQDAQLGLRQLLGKRSVTLEQAAWRYRERRGRHPPPGFDAWFAAAGKSKAIIVEDFFDRIYHDIGPLWGIEPAELRRRSRKQPFMIRVRDGEVEMDTVSKEPPYRVRQWAKLVTEMSPHIPDLDMAVNVMDESRVLVPWDDIAGYMRTERANRRVVPVSEAVLEYSGLHDVHGSRDRYNPHWIGGEVKKYWDHVRAACPPDSPARNLSALPKFDVPVEYPASPSSAYTRGGYIYNFTASQDSCLQPHLRGLHGTFVESISMSTTHELLPLFGECKLPQNNELLIPGAVYLDDERLEYSGGGDHGGSWRRKKDALVWRGVSSGARNKKNNWWHIHRHRFVQMLNGTTVSELESRFAREAKTFVLPAEDVYSVPAQREGRLGAWVSSFADVGFVDVLCDPPDFEQHWWKGKIRSKICRFVAPFFSIANEVSMKEQYDYKFLPDVDGNSFSGRYRAFLLSTSLPLKSTIYTEWHDSRLFPWVHFVPFDNSFMDVYGIMDYFLNGHDEEAERIAGEGKAWAEATLRREDMRLYVWRLLLEYARVNDDARDRLAYVNDWDVKV